jgi:hypothetical protein
MTAESLVVLSTLACWPGCAGGREPERGSATAPGNAAGKGGAEGDDSPDHRELCRKVR